MTNPLRSISTRATPQGEQARPEQVANSAGGFVFPLDEWAQLRRFLILGTEGGTYYASEHKLTKENAGVVMRCAASDPTRLVNEIVAVSDAGRAKKNDQAIFALAVASACDDSQGRAAALAAIPQVCRTGTHLFMFCDFVQNFRGWGPALTKAVSAWYTDRRLSSLAGQLVKYRQRDGWTHRDVLRRAHPSPVRRSGNWEPEFTVSESKDRAALYDFACGRITNPADSRLEGEVFGGVRAYLRLLNEEATLSAWDAARIVEEASLPWEAVPDKFLAAPAVWEALLPHMGTTALIRNLGRMTGLGLLGPLNQATKAACASLTNEDELRAGRVHPLSVLVALATYKAGHSVKGSLTWTPIRAIIDALDEAFYLSFGAVEPTGKRTMLALDVSGSMDGGEVAGTFLTPREAAAAMAMVTARTEEQWVCVGFTSGTGAPARYRDQSEISELAISPRQRLDDVVAYTRSLPFGGTDCALPMLHALREGLEVDTFVIYTDNETWAGDVHPFQALIQYREKTGIPARLAVVGMTSTSFSIADPSDAGMLDVVGFDTAAPNLLSAFSRGEL